MGRLGFYFDSRICIGCRTCQIACKDKNDLDVGANFRKVHTFETGKFPTAKFYHFSRSCNHCADAKCVKGCPTGAMHYGADGTVQHDNTVCIGCRYCTWNCPYAAPQYLEEKGVIGKCNSCIDLRDAGQNPVCVDACPMRCIKFGDIDALEAEYGPGTVREIASIADASITDPSLVIYPKACALDPMFTEVEV